MTMDQMQAAMARMHQQNYNYDMQLSRHFQEVSRTYAAMAQGEYQMYQMHQGQAQGTMPGPGAMSGQQTFTPVYWE